MFRFVSALRVHLIIQYEVWHEKATTMKSGHIAFELYAYLHKLGEGKGRRKLPQKIYCNILERLAKLTFDATESHNCLKY